MLNLGIRESSSQLQRWLPRPSMYTAFPALQQVYALVVAVHIRLPHNLWIYRHHARNCANRWRRSVPSDTCRTCDPRLRPSLPRAAVFNKPVGRLRPWRLLSGALLCQKKMDFVVSGASGTAEREALPVLLDGARKRGFRPRTIGADRGYETRMCVREMRIRGVTPHVARRVRSSIDGRTTRHPGYARSQRMRKRVEELFGWMKAVGDFRHTRCRGVERRAWPVTW